MKHVKGFKTFENNQEDIIRKLQNFLYSYFEERYPEIDVRVNVMDEFPNNFIHLWIGNFEAFISKGFDGHRDSLDVSIEKGLALSKKKIFQDFEVNDFEGIAKYIEQHVNGNVKNDAPINQSKTYTTEEVIQLLADYRNECAEWIPSQEPDPREWLESLNKK